MATSFSHKDRIRKLNPKATLTFFTFGLTLTLDSIQKRILTAKSVLHDTFTLTNPVSRSLEWDTLHKSLNCKRLLLRNAALRTLRLSSGPSSSESNSPSDTAVHRCVCTSAE